MGSGKMTESSEVYSFGMVLLEVMLNMMPAGLIGEQFVYPIQECIAPSVPGALERAVTSADTAAGWPAPVAHEVAKLAMACIDADESRRPNFNEICRLLRFLQEQFPPTCVMAPLQNLPPVGVPPPPLQTGVLNMTPQMPQLAMPPPQGPQQLLPQGIQLVGPPAPAPAVIPLGTVPPGVVLQQGTIMPNLAVGPGRPPFPPQQVQQAGQHLTTSGFPMTTSGFPMTGMVGAPPGVCIAQPGPAVPHPQVVLVHQVNGPQAQAAAEAAPPLLQSFHPPQAAAPPAVAPGGLTPVEVALEVAHVHGAELAKMRPEFRMLPVLPAIDAEGRRMAVLGRQHQPQWFEAVLLDHTDLSCISREAFTLSWGGADLAQAALSLRVTGSNIILVDDTVAPIGKPIPLQPGSLITFAFQGADSGHNLFVILSFHVHCAPQLAAPGCGGLTPPPPLAPGGNVPPSRPTCGCEEVRSGEALISTEVEV